MKYQSAFGEGLEMFQSGRRGEEADDEEAEERGDQRREDGVALAYRRGEMRCDGVPGDGDDGAYSDAGYGCGGGGTLPEEGREDDWGEGGGVDGVGVEGFFEDGLGTERLEERPQAEQDDHEPADDEDLLVRGVGAKVADVDIVDQVGGRGEEPVVGGGDDLGEDGSHKEGAEELEGEGAVAESVEAGVGEDLAGGLADFTGGKERGTGDGDGDDDGLEDDGADDPADDSAGGVLLGFSGEELLVHGLVAQEEEAGGEEELEALDGGEIAEELEVRGRERGVDGRPSAGSVDEDGESEAHGDRGEEADEEVHVGNRRHAGDGGEDDNEGGEDVTAHDGRDGVREDKVEDVSTADELVACDGGVGEQDRDHAEDAGGLVVAGFEEVGDGELGELAGAGSDEVDKQEAGPSSASLPEGDKAVFVGIFGAAEEGAGADPAGE